MEIKHRYTGAALFSADTASISELVQLAIGKKAYLRHADLSGADLTGANLMGAYLRHADLSGADLTGADLRCAYLRHADLSGANLRHADLSGADLRHADLSGANLRHADLSGANLMGADLRCAYLRHANLMGADLRCAYLRHADLRPFAIVPEVGQFTAFKNVWNGYSQYIAELIVPADAKRINTPTSRKCRVSAARVIAVTNLDGTPTEQTQFVSAHDETFIYRVGDLVEPRKPFNDDIRIECASGIHCFITRREAVEY